MSKNVYLSILIPVYNVADYLNECIDSILTQVDKCVEIILLDDCSPDNSRDILRQYEHLSQVTVLEGKKNRGLSGARNYLLEHATGEYVWFIDSDDVMHEGAYKKVINVLQAKPVDVLFGNYIAWRGNYRRKKNGFKGKANKFYYNKQDAFFKNLVITNSNYAWNKIFRKSVIDNISFKEGIKFEDIYYMADLSGLVETYSYINYPLIDYREREGSIIQTVDKKYIDDYLTAFIYRVQVWQSRNNTNDKFTDYLLYKSFSRFAGLIKENKVTDGTMMKYVMEAYAPTFYGYKNAIKPTFNFIRKKKLDYKAKKIEVIIHHVLAN